MHEGFAMSKSFTVFTSSLVVTAAVLAPFGLASSQVKADGLQNSVNAESSSRFLYPNNVVCKLFEKTGYQTWRLRDRLTLDLGNWGGAFSISGAIEPGAFKSKGIDLFDVLESKCGLHASAEFRRFVVNSLWPEMRRSLSPEDARLWR